jgi:pimeloyl-ACP methyl ester carboxylesterase
MWICMQALQFERPREWWPKERFRTGDVELEYICMPQAGKGARTLVFINGWCLRHSEWKAQMHRFSDCNLLFFNNRGHGESGLGCSTPATYLQDCAGDTLGLMARLGLERVTLVVHSMGTLIGALASAADGSPVDSMVMVSPVPGNPMDTLPYGWMFGPFIGAVERALGEPQSAEVARWYARNFRSGVFMVPSYLYFKAATFSGVSLDTYRKFVESVLDMGNGTFLTAFRAMVENGDEIGKGMRDLRIPVLAVAGNGDFLVGPHALEILRGRMPHMEMEIFRSATHFPHAERPEEFNKLVGDFVGRVDGSRP